MAQNKRGDSTTASPLERLKVEATDLVTAVGDRAFTSLRDRVEDATDRLTDYAKGTGTTGVKAAVSGAKSLAHGKSPMRSMLGAGATALKERVGSMLGKDGGGKGLKVTNIIESIDVGVPVKLAYDQWTRFTDFPTFMKKVENVEQVDDQKVSWKAQVLWSHREWESTILEQSPDDKIVWRSKGPKGYVDGAVTFHELAPNLTRILVALEYHPQGLFERTGNIWRAPGRRVRLELKHFRRHVMSEVLLHSDDVEGWRGVISDGEVKGQRRSRGGGRTRARSSQADAGERQSASGKRGSQERGGSSGNGRSGGKSSRGASGERSSRSGGSGEREGGSSSGRGAGKSGSGSKTGQSAGRSTSGRSS